MQGRHGDCGAPQDEEHKTMRKKEAESKPAGKISSLLSAQFQPVASVFLCGTAGREKDQLLYTVT